jgi:hypothetical protein
MKMAQRTTVANNTGKTGAIKTFIRFLHVGGIDLDGATRENNGDKK